MTEFSQAERSRLPRPGNWATAALTAALLALTTAASAQDRSRTAVGQLAVDARNVLAARCASCHDAASSPKVEGRFGHVLDFDRLTAEGGLVVPGDPDASDLWFTIEIGDMPPSDTHTGLLSGVEKRVLRQWIEAGTPAPTDPPQSTPVLESETPQPVQNGDALRWGTLFGRMHVLAVHLPIALVLAAAAAELLRLLHRAPALQTASVFCLWLAAVGAAAATATGWVFRGERTFVGDRLDMIILHQWSGTAATVIVIVAAVLAVVPRRRTAATVWTSRIALAAALLSITLTAHWGGESVHGVNFLPW